MSVDPAVATDARQPERAAPILSVRDFSLGLNEQIRLSLPYETLEERVRLWESLKDKSYQLSFTCLLRTARLFSSRVFDEVPVASFASTDFPAEEAN